MVGQAERLAQIQLEPALYQIGTLTNLVRKHAGRPLRPYATWSYCAGADRRARLDGVANSTAALLSALADSRLRTDRASCSVARASTRQNATTGLAPSKKPMCNVHCRTGEVLGRIRFAEAQERRHIRRRQRQARPLQDANKAIPCMFNIRFISWFLLACAACLSAARGGEAVTEDEVVDVVY